MGGYATIAYLQPDPERIDITIPIVPDMLYSYSSVPGNQAIDYISFAAEFYQGKVLVDSSSGTLNTDANISMSSLVNGALYVYVDYVTVGGLFFRSALVLYFDAAGLITHEVEAKGLDLPEVPLNVGYSACGSIVATAIGGDQWIESGNGWGIIAIDGEYLQILNSNAETLEIPLPNLADTNDPLINILYFGDLDDTTWADLPDDLRDNFFGVVMQMNNSCGEPFEVQHTPLSPIM